MSRRSTSVSFLSSAAFVAVLAASPAAFAGNEAAAEALFGEAKKLAAAGKYAEACPKFAESNRLDRGAGTMIHLGDCYEKNKQTASAWATFKEAASAAQAQNRKDWEKLAQQRAAALEPKLAKLTIKVEKPADKLEVMRDGTAISQPSWGVPIPVDSGEHKIEATAPGRKPFKTVVSVAKDGQSVDVTVPALEEDASAAAKPETQAQPDKPETQAQPDKAAAKSEGSSQRTVGFAVAGLGIVGVAVGAVTGLMAMNKANDAKDICPADGGCASREAVDASDSANTLGLVSTLGFVVGAAALAGGAVLILTAPKASKEAAAPAALRVAPKAGPGGGGLVLSGYF